MKLYGQEVLAYPGVPDRATLLLRARLILEEALEFVEEAGMTVHLAIDDKGKLEVIDEGGEPDLVGMADACGDILVVTYGALNSIGIQSGPLYEEITRSNNSKVFPDGTVHKNDYGKVIKPPAYSPPDIKAVIDRCKSISTVDKLMEAYPKVREVASKGMNIWSWMTAEAYGAAFKFTYSTAQQAKDIGGIGSYTRVALARKAVKAIMSFYPTELSDHRLAKYLGTTDAVAEELLTLFEDRFPKITPPRPKKESV